MLTLLARYTIWYPLFEPTLTIIYSPNPHPKLAPRRMKRSSSRLTPDSNALPVVDAEDAAVTVETEAAVADVDVVHPEDGLTVMVTAPPPSTSMMRRHSHPSLRHLLSDSKKKNWSQEKNMLRCVLPCSSPPPPPFALL